MPSFPSNISHSPPAKSLPYSGQYYYKLEFALELQQALRAYLAANRRGLEYNFVDMGEPPKRLAVRLNCARAYIMQNPGDFDHSVVELAHIITFKKLGQRLVLYEGRRPPNVIGSPMYIKPLHDAFTIPDVDSNNINVTYVRTLAAQALAIGGLESAPTKIEQDDLSDLDPDPLEMSIIQEIIESITTLSKGPADKVYERDSLNLGVSDMSAIKAHYTSLNLAGRVTANKVKVVKLANTPT